MHAENGVDRLEARPVGTSSSLVKFSTPNARMYTHTYLFVGHVDAGHLSGRPHQLRTYEKGSRADGGVVSARGEKGQSIRYIFLARIHIAS